MVKKDEKIWALLVQLGTAVFIDHVYDELVFDDSVWDKIVEECAKHKYNTILLDVAEGLQYGSHPELAKKGAWSRTRLKKEIKRLKDLGLTIIPKLNFSAMHDAWLGEYSRMISTKTYYHVCRDLINEAYDLFDKPKYIHLGMDEEDIEHTKKHDYVTIRKGELLWHDLQFLFDCVHDVGATPWIWTDQCFDYPEEFMKRFGPEDVVLSPWQYNALNPEHFTPVSSRQVYIDYYNKPRYRGMNIQYVEDDPWLVKYREMLPKYLEKGYKVFPCMSDANDCGEINCMDTLEFFKEKADAQTLGYVMAPWLLTTKDGEAGIVRNIELMANARKKIYK